MKNSILFILMILATNAFTQNPKIRVQESFFSTNYEIGDKDATAKDVRLHLEKTGPAESYDLWQKGYKQQVNGNIFLGLGTAGLLVGLLAESDEAKLAGYMVGVIGSTTSLVFYLSSNKNGMNAIKKYNRANGY